MNEHVELSEFCLKLFTHRLQRSIARYVALERRAAAQFGRKFLDLVTDALALKGKGELRTVLVELPRDARGDRPPICNARNERAFSL
jgi:hypothetical protein